MDTLPDHYATLGLDRRCTLAQIRAAYRLLAKRHHPDVNAGSPEAVAQTQALNAAYETLSDPARRHAYDRELETPRRTAAPAARAKIERNITQDAHLRIDEFLRGTEFEVRVQDPANPHGAETYRVAVPPETAPGTRLRIPRTDPFADGFLQLRLRVRPGARFKARGSDLRCDLRINSRRATQGGSEMIPGPAVGMLRVNIPAGVARGAIVTVPGEGLPKPRGGRGDLLIRITYRPEVRITRTGFR